MSSTARTALFLPPLPLRLPCSPTTPTVTPAPFHHLQGIAESAARLAFEVLGGRVYDAAVAEPGAVKTASGLVILHEVEGDGASPTTADTVEVHYEGRNADGIAFDSSYAPDEQVASRCQSFLRPLHVLSTFPA